MDWTSHTMERIPESGTLKMFDIAKDLESQGKKVYHFEVGQPDFPTPDNVVNAGIEALSKLQYQHAEYPKSWMLFRDTISPVASLSTGREILLSHLEPRWHYSKAFSVQSILEMMSYFWLLLGLHTVS
jgi:hypothetical protein